MDYGREFNAARKAQGFVSQADRKRPKTRAAARGVNHEPAR